MDIQIFVNRRKELGLSQIELSEGICTQATLSRFENHGQIPSMKILTLLCKKLHMDVGELFPSVAIKDSFNHTATMEIFILKRFHSNLIRKGKYR